jgi:site-specific DNA recombinase
MRIALYVRVSTAAQAQAQTIEQQLDRLREHVAAQGWSVVETHIFRDDGYSGATLRRPGLDRLRDVARERAIDLVLVTTPDRLARKYVHQVLLVEEFERCGCPVTFLDRPMSQDPHDQLLLQIRGAVAEYERSLIAERMRRGRLAKLRAGLLLPWTKPPYGYRLHPERPRDPAGVTLDPVEAAVVTEIFAAYLEPGASLASVIRTLHERQVRSPSGQAWWGLASVRGVLTNPAYTGQVYAGRTRLRPPRLRRSATHLIGRPHGSATPVPCEEWIPVATIPAVVSQEQFALVREKLAHNQAFARRRNTAHCYLLRALVSCGRRQSACTAQTSASGHAYYTCSGKHQAQRTQRETRCAARFIPARQLEALVWADLCALLTDPASITQALERAQGGQWLPQAVQARQANLRKGRTSLAQQVERLTQAYLHDVIPPGEYERRRRDLEQQDRSLALQEEHLAAEAARHHELAGLVTHIEAFCQRVQAGLASATFEQQRQLVELLIDRVVVTDDQVDIRYAIPTSPEGERLRFCYLRTDYPRDAQRGVCGRRLTSQYGLPLMVSESSRVLTRTCRCRPLYSRPLLSRPARRRPRPSPRGLPN